MKTETSINYTFGRCFFQTFQAVVTFSDSGPKENVTLEKSFTVAAYSVSPLYGYQTLIVDCSHRSRL